MKGIYQDYGVHRVTAFDIFNANYGAYTGPMLSALLKEKGITPPRYFFMLMFIHRKVVDRVQILIGQIDEAMRSRYRVHAHLLL